ncbi:O-methyltransferase, partial [Phytoactinopolyspora endophytica]|uniref:O-methyltransferase n=1 Tax=Phytoactinopolyspora endophytica TaxID=1642495 RepID=UPI0013EC7706
MSRWMDDKVEGYLTDLAGTEHDDPVLTEMEALAEEKGFPIVGRASGRYLELAARSIGASRVMELGSGYGYSAYWFARAVGPAGSVVCTEGDPENARLAEQYLRQAGVWDRVTYKVGDALEVFAEEDGEFDIVYCDVDKDGYPDCWLAARDRIRVGGLWLCDNVIWHGHVATGTDREELPEWTRGWTKDIQEHNRLVAEDERFIGSIVPIRDGIMAALRIAMIPS